MQINLKYNHTIDTLIQCRLTEKKQFMELILEVCNLLLANPDIKGEGDFYLDTLNYRIFFSYKNINNDIKKHFSFQFPFAVDKKSEKYNIKLIGKNISIKPQYTSFILKLLKEGAFGKNSSFHDLALQLPDLIMDIADGQVKSSNEDLFNIYEIIHELLIFEPSYLRFEEDKVNFNPHAPDVHPKYHFDIFYSRSTFKLGVDKKCDLDKFLQILDNYSTNKNCCYINLN